MIIENLHFRKEEHMDIQKAICNKKQKMEEELKLLKKEIVKLEKVSEGGKLTCKCNRQFSQYYLDGKYVSKNNIEKLKGIAQLDYDKRVADKLEKGLNAMNRALSFLKDDNMEYEYSRLCSSRKELVTPVYAPTEEFVKAWFAVEYEPYGRWENVKTEFYTLKGERVRSKAEKMIADELTAYGVPYRYEAPLELTDRGEKRIVRPDFTALNCRTREEYILEHLGMMDKYEYSNAAMNKLDIYERNGYLLGVNLLLLHETAEAPLNIQVVRRYIEEYLT